MKFYFLVFFYESPNPGTLFFVCVKLLISLLNGAFFRLGENFSVRGYGARFFAEQNFASDEKLAKSIFWYFFTKTRTPGHFFLFV